ncbi:MAG: tetratricopeptide repeat protein, partial [Vulcanimicrobiota bacterium]
MLNRRGPSGYEELKIDKTIYTPANVGQRFERITKYFEESGKNTPDLELYSQFIDMLWRNRQYEQALLAVRNAREKYPGSLYLLEKEGGILLDADFLDDAIDLFTKLKEEYSGRYEIFEDLGYSLLKRGKLDEAEKNLMEALEFKTWDPSHLMSQLHITEKLAQLYYKKEEYEKAMEFLEEILGVQPRSTKWQLYFKVLEKLGKTSELEEARITYERIKKARMYASRAQKYENQYKYELALKNYRKAVDENPYEPHYYFSIGNLLENLPEDEYEYQYEEATEYYRTATELFPNNPFYMMSYVGNLITIQEWEQAFETAKTSAHKFPELMIPNLRYLSEVLAKESEYAQLLEELLELDEAMELSELRAELALVLK